MKKIVLVFLFCTVQQFYAQNFQTVEEVNDACSTLGFSTNEDAEIAVDRILDQVGLFRNFIIVECPNINNAVARNIEMEDGLKGRYILYDAEFFTRFNDAALNDWPALSILAHEIGHHLNGHALNNLGSNHKFELEADEFSGFVLGKMNATLSEAQSAIASLRYEKATHTHPAKADRLARIEKGWKKAGNNIKIIEDDSNLEAESYYTKGLKEYQNENYIDALFLFSKAGDKNHVLSQSYCGFMYETGKGINKDFTKSVYWYKKAANLGDSYSQNNLAGLYKNGEGVTKNMATAAYWYRKAAENGYAKSQSNLGILYREGDGVPLDYNTAISWFRKAANQDNTLGQSNLGYLYEFGLGFQKDYVQALYWYRKAANLGDSYSQNKLGTFYRDGTAVSINKYTSFSWFEKSAKQGRASAQSNLGWMYLEGEGVVKNYASALYWLEKAANQENATAQTNLAYMYATGKGVVEDDARGISWYKRAAKNGGKSAQEYLTSIGETW